MSDKTNIALTGASGFIGKSLLKRLLDNNFHVTVLDYGGHVYPKSVEVVRGNLLTMEGLDDFLKGKDILIHLAGQVLPEGVSMEEGNALATKNLVEKAEIYKIQKIIFSSTIAVYGSSVEKVFKETDKCIPDTEYGKSKLKAEVTIKKWAEATGGKYAILRFFSLYGTESIKGFVYDFCQSIIEKREIFLYGSGEQKRDLVWVEDAVTSIFLSLERNISGIYNIGSGKNYSLLEVISILKKVSGKNVTVIHKSVDSGKVGNILYSVEKMKKVFGWVPEMETEKGVGLVYKSLVRNIEG